MRNHVFTNNEITLFDAKIEGSKNLHMSPRNVGLMLSQRRRR